MSVGFKSTNSFLLFLNLTAKFHFLSKYTSLKVFDSRNIPPKALEDKTNLAFLLSNSGLTANTLKLKVSVVSQVKSPCVSLASCTPKSDEVINGVEKNNSESHHLVYP